MSDSFNAAGSAADGLPGGRPKLLLAFLTLALALSYIDRYLMAVLVQPIKAELLLSDGQIGLLTGFAFSIFYATVGLPLARFADRGHRRLVIGGSIAVWSIITAATAFVHSFVQLALARFGVGAGEAGIFPTSQAVIADTFPAERRTSAMAIFASGGSIGLLVAFAAGAALEARFGWRTTFLIAALPGAVLAPIAFFLIPLQARGGGAQARVGSAADLWRNPHFRQLPFAQSAVVILLFTQAQWFPAFFERSFSMDRATLGAILGVLLSGATIFGSILGGVLADRLRPRGNDAPMHMARYSVLAGVPVMIALYLSGNFKVALGLAALSSFLFAMPTGTIAAHLQFVVQPWERASAAAWAVMIASLLGGGLGPFAVGVISDGLAGTAGVESLRYALLSVMLCAAAWAVFHLTRLVGLSRGVVD